MGRLIRPKTSCLPEGAIRPVEGDLPEGAIIPRGSNSRKGLAQCPTTTPCDRLGVSERRALADTATIEIAPAASETRSTGRPGSSDGPVSEDSFLLSDDEMGASYVESNNAEKEDEQEEDNVHLHPYKIDRGVELAQFDKLEFDNLPTKKHLTGYLKNNRPLTLIDEYGTVQPDASQPISIGFSKGSKNTALIVSQKFLHKYMSSDGSLDHDFMVMLDVEAFSSEVGGTTMNFIGLMQITFWLPVWDTDQYGHVRRDDHERWKKLLVECTYQAYVTMDGLGVDRDIDLLLPSGSGTFTWHEGDLSRQGLFTDNEKHILKAFDDKWQPAASYTGTVAARTKTDPTILMVRGSSS